MAEDAGGNRIFGVQVPFSALPNHVNALYILKKGDNPISGSYSFLFKDSVRDNYGNYYDLRISESNIKIGSREERGVRGSDYMTLFSADRGLVSRFIGGSSSARNWQNTAPNTGAISNPEDNYGSTEIYLGVGIVGLLLLVVAGFKTKKHKA